MKLLFDNNISPRVARAVNELISNEQGWLAVALRTRFPPDTPDIEWIERLGTEGGWSVISADLRIQRNKAERAAWMQTDLIGYFLEPALASLAPVDQTARLLTRLAAIESQGKLVRGPAMFSIPIRGSLRQVRAV